MGESLFVSHVMSLLDPVTVVIVVSVFQARPRSYPNPSLLVFVPKPNHTFFLCRNQITWQHIIWHDNDVLRLLACEAGTYWSISVVVMTTYNGY